MSKPVMTKGLHISWLELEAKKHLMSEFYEPEKF